MSEFHRSPHIFVGKVDLNVQDLDRALEFYQKVIGFQILERTHRQAKLTADGKTTLLKLEQPENVLPRQSHTTGLYHFALLLPQRSDLGRLLNHFINNRFRLQGAADHLVSEAVYLADPDGNGIEVYIDRPASTWEWTGDQVKMTSDPLDVESLLAEGNGEPWEGLPADTVMGHIHLQVADLQSTEDFYKKGLGLDIVCRFGNQALFTSTGGYHHHIGLNTWAGEGAPPPPENSVGLNSFSLVFPDDKAREKVVQQLRAIGAEVTQENGEYQLKDPSGNRIQLVKGDMHNE